MKRLKDRLLELEKKKKINNHTVAIKYINKESSIYIECEQKTYNNQEFKTFMKDNEGLNFNIITVQFV